MTCVSLRSCPTPPSRSSTSSTWLGRCTSTSWRRRWSCTTSWATAWGGHRPPSSTRAGAWPSSSSRRSRGETGGGDGGNLTGFHEKCCGIELIEIQKMLQTWQNVFLRRGKVCNLWVNEPIKIAINLFFSKVQPMRQFWLLFHSFGALFARLGSHANKTDDCFL